MKPKQTIMEKYLLKSQKCEINLSTFSYVYAELLRYLSSNSSSF